MFQNLIRSSAVLEGRLCSKYDVYIMLFLIIVTIMCLMGLQTICLYHGGHFDSDK